MVSDASTESDHIFIPDIVIEIRREKRGDVAAYISIGIKPTDICLPYRLVYII